MIYATKPQFIVIKQKHLYYNTIFFYYKIIQLVAPLLVKINGTETLQTTVDGWQYSPSANTIAFFGNAMPKVGDVLRVDYEYIN